MSLVSDPEWRWKNLVVQILSGTQVMALMRLLPFAAIRLLVQANACAGSVIQLR